MNRLGAFSPAASSRASVRRLVAAVKIAQPSCGNAAARPHQAIVASCAAQLSGQSVSSSLRGVSALACRPSTIAVAMLGESHDSRMSLAMRWRQRCWSAAISRIERSGDANTRSRMARASDSSATSFGSRVDVCPPGPVRTSLVALPSRTLVAAASRTSGAASVGSARPWAADDAEPRG